MDVGQLLARMSPQAVNYAAVGGGGQPELTTSDIAGALAFVPKGLGRSVLEAVYWPDGATLRSSELLDEVMKVVLPELNRQAQQLNEASVDVQLVQMAIRYTRANTTLSQQQALTRAQLRLDALKIVAWPKNTIERIPLIVKGILTELSGMGRYSISAGDELLGNGGSLAALHHGYRSRAKLMNCNEKTYLRHWKPIYEWLYELINEAHVQAMRLFKKALVNRDVSSLVIC